MSHLAYKPFYRRNLPHFQPEGATLFVTFRLFGSMPREKIDRWVHDRQMLKYRLQAIADKDEQERVRYIEQKRQFGRWDQWLHEAQEGPTWLALDKIASIIADCLHYRDGRVFRLDAFCIMSNHVHLVFAPLCEQNGTPFALQSIMQSLKGYSASKANQLLNRTGTFWQAENYDHVIRDEAEWHRVMWYVLQNPVKAGLVDRWEEWRWSYCRYLDGGRQGTD